MREKVKRCKKALAGRAAEGRRQHVRDNCVIVYRNAEFSSEKGRHLGCLVYKAILCFRFKTFTEYFSKFF